MLQDPDALNGDDRTISTAAGEIRGYLGGVGRTAGMVADHDLNRRFVTLGCPLPRPLLATPSFDLEGSVAAMVA